jgi:HK97 family phage prohead protease
MTAVQRYAPLLDLTVRSAGTGRTIDAYAAVFDTPQEIRDRQGHYTEVIDRAAFDRTIVQRAGRFQVLFNHGMSRYGTPSDRYTMPYGRAVDVRADERGLVTTTEVSRTPLGDEILELAKDGALTGQSFSGNVVRTATQAPAKRGALRTLVRQEIALDEYGLTPFPAYVDAQVVAIRSEARQLLEDLDREELGQYLAGLSDTARADLRRALDLALADPGTGTPHVDLADPGTDDEPTHRNRREQSLRRLTLFPKES